MPKPATRSQFAAAGLSVGGRRLVPRWWCHAEQLTHEEVEALPLAVGTELAAAAGIVLAPGTTSRSKSLFAFCGSLAACELTTRGASVVVVEAGPRLEPATDLRNSEGNAARIM